MHFINATAHQATTATEIPHGDGENCDWSASAAAVLPQVADAGGDC